MSMVNFDMFKKKHRSDAENDADEEIMSVVDEAHEKGDLEQDEADMIENILSFGDTDARDIMTRRSDIRALDGSLTLEEAVGRVLDFSNSRFPVYQGNIDTILGVVTFRDLMNKYIRSPENRTIAIEDIPKLIREVSVIPESRPIDSIFQYMRSKKVQIVIVVDEYGQTSGLVAMEDILEEIVGNILDEYDTDDHFIQRSFDDSIIMDGMTPLERAGEVLKYDFSGEEYETLNGYLTALLGHIPTEADHTVAGKKFLFHILKVDHHTIRKVRAERQPAAARKEN